MMTVLVAALFAGLYPNGVPVKSRLNVRLCNILSVLLILIGLVVSGPIDSDATQETKTLFQRLKDVASDPDKIIFGQQRSTQTGIYGWKAPYNKGDKGGWAYTVDMSRNNDKDELCDMKSVTGDYPGLIGFNLGDVDPKENEVIYALTKFAYARGSLIAYHIPMSNPATGGSHNIKEDSGDVLHSVRKVLPGGDKHANLLSVLDRLADFISTVKDDNGKLIPVLFRPYHENNAHWYWYGQNNAANNTYDEYISLYQFTVKYLRDTKGIHNFLYVYAPSDQNVDFNTDGNTVAYLKTYPGDDYVDVMAFDGYHNVLTDDLVPTYVRHVNELVVQARERGKIPAIAEIGLKRSGINKYRTFWMGRILTPIKASSVTRGLAYIMTWTNRCAKTCTTWVPYKDHASEADFLTFYRDNITVFSKDMPNMYT